MEIPTNNWFELNELVICWFPGLRRGPRRALRPLSGGPSRCRRCWSRRGRFCYGVNLMRSKFVEESGFALLCCLSCSLLPVYALLELRVSKDLWFSRTLKTNLNIIYSDLSVTLSKVDIIILSRFVTSSFMSLWHPCPEENARTANGGTTPRRRLRIKKQGIPREAERQSEIKTLTVSKKHIFFT